MTEWTCAAKQQGSVGGNDPEDCGWPLCGCDPDAARVVAALDEMGMLRPHPLSAASLRAAAEANPIVIRRRDPRSA